MRSSLGTPGESARVGNRGFANEWQARGRSLDSTAPNARREGAPAIVRAAPRHVDTTRRRPLPCAIRHHVGTGGHRRRKVRAGTGAGRCFVAQRSIAAPSRTTLKPIIPERP